MHKIMFDDKYCLTQAVLEGRKTMTRRTITSITPEDSEYLETAFDWDLRESVIIDRYARYKVGEVVAVAQAYRDILEYNPEDYEDVMLSYGALGYASHPYSQLMNSAGWVNKMFVRADLMPHQIRITSVRVEHIQDISEDDCLREGVVRFTCNLYEFRGICYSFDGDKAKMGTYLTARDAFAALIKKMAGKKAWDSNPWVFVYEFELVK